MPFFMENPRATNPTRAQALQTYLLLHSQHDELVRRLQSPSPSPSPTTPSTSLNALSSPSPPPPPPPQDSNYQDPQTLLLTINNQTKATLTSLLACSSTREDPNFRAWVQSRLMETEQELRDWRRWSVHAEDARREAHGHASGGG
ncbi:MAG: hypothetical protein M1840_009042 [Geoglossum simile]|nr:MAG: hypothetical protein M1840_009042 [Geoglossum simile]